MDGILFLSLNTQKLPLEKISELQKDFESFKDKEKLDQIFLNTKLENPIIVALSAFGITLIVYAILFFLFLGIAGGVLYGIDWLFGSNILYTANSSKTLDIILKIIFGLIMLFCVVWGVMEFKKTKQNNFTALKQFLSKMTKNSQENKVD